MYNALMGSDLITLNALAKELNSKIKGAKIQKITQPEKDEIRLFIHTFSTNACLVISCNSQVPRCHLTKAKNDNPLSAPAFCMLLRKYITNATIEDVSIYNADRIIKIRMSARDELKDINTYFLYVEIMSRYSNIIFTDKDNIILDAVKKIPLSLENNSHIVMHGSEYSPLDQDRESFITSDFSFLKKFKGGSLHQFILDNVTGFSGISVSEIIARAGLNDDMPTSLTQDEIEKFKSFIERIKNITEDEIYSPCVIDNKGVYPFVYSVINKEVKKYDSMNEAFDALLSKEDDDIRLKARLKALTTATKRFKGRVEKRIIDSKQKLQATEDMENLRKFGDLIINNIYLIKKGDTVLNCIDYETNENVSIELDKRFTPSQNAKNYYAKYNKLKRAKEFLTNKLEEDETLYKYIKSIEEELNNVTKTTNPIPIEQELVNIGALKLPKENAKKRVHNPRPDPLMSYEIGGFQVLIGNNNIQNDELTFKIASSTDIWMHLKDEHGRHTIIITNGKDVPEDVLFIAAQITAATKTSKMAVDYTQRRNVRRMPGGLPGLVNYTNYKTIYVDPDAHLELLKK